MSQESPLIMELPPTLTDAVTRLESLEHHSSTILLLSAINLFANILTILVAFVIAL